MGKLAHKTEYFDKKFEYCKSVIRQFKEIDHFDIRVSTKLRGAEAVTERSKGDIERWIAFNFDFLNNPVYEHLIDDTILHEVAHALDYVRNGKLNHGKTWKDICDEIGARPERYEIESVWTTPSSKKCHKYMLICPDCELENFTSCDLNKYVYRCRHCNAKLDYFVYKKTNGVFKEFKRG